MSEGEKIKFCTISAPRRFFQIEDTLMHSDHWSDDLPNCQWAIRDAFWTMFDGASEATLFAAAKKFVDVLKENSESYIKTYSRNFFIPVMLEKMSENDANFVKDYFFGAMSDGIDIDLLSAVQGLDRYIVEDEVNRYVDPLVKAMLKKDNDAISKKIRKYLESSAISVDRIQDFITQRLIVWRNGIKQDSHKEMLTSIIDYREFPF